MVTFLGHVDRDTLQSSGLSSLRLAGHLDLDVGEHLSEILSLWQQHDDLAERYVKSLRQMVSIAYYIVFLSQKGLNLSKCLSTEWVEDDYQFQKELKYALLVNGQVSRCGRCVEFGGLAHRIGLCYDNLQQLAAELMAANLLRNDILLIESPGKPTIAVSKDRLYELVSQTPEKQVTAGALPADFLAAIDTVRRHLNESVRQSVQAGSGTDSLSLVDAVSKLPVQVLYFFVALYCDQEWMDATFRLDSPTPFAQQVVRYLLDNHRLAEDVVVRTKLSRAVFAAAQTVYTVNRNANDIQKLLGVAATHMRETSTAMRPLAPHQRTASRTPILLPQLALDEYASRPETMANCRTMFLAGRNR